MTLEQRMAEIRQLPVDDRYTALREIAREHSRLRWEAESREMQDRMAE